MYRDVELYVCHEIDGVDIEWTIHALVGPASPGGWSEPAGAPEVDFYKVTATSTVAPEPIEVSFEAFKGIMRLANPKWSVDTLYEDAVVSAADADYAAWEDHQILLGDMRREE